MATTTAMRVGISLAQHIVSSAHWPPTQVGLLRCHWQSLAGNLCLQRPTQVSRQITWDCSQRWQRSGVPDVDGHTVAELRSRLRFGSDRELRQFWRRTGVRLDAMRATNALHVLAMLEAEGLPLAAIKRRSALLNIKQAHLSTLLFSLRQLPVPVTDVFPLLLLTPDHLRLAARAAREDGTSSFPKVPSRLHYLASQLKTKLETLCNALRRNPTVLFAPAGRIIEVTQLLIDGGIPRGTILDDPHIYNHNVDVMRDRLDWVHQVQLRPLRPWMLRCPEHILQEHIERFQLRLAILSEHGDEVAYLSERLGLRRAQVSAFQYRYPPALRVSVIKMKAVLDVLLAYGISGEQVADQPRILCYSALRIQERCERLRAAGLRPASLLVLCKTPRDFDRYMVAATGSDGPTVAGREGGGTGLTDGGQLPRIPAA